MNAIWSRSSFDGLTKVLLEDRPDVAHVHNTFADLSASVYWALARQGIPVVQTLHNYRWLCPQSTFLRDGLPCEKCVGRAAYPAMLHRCTYNGSFAASAVIAGGNLTHSALKTYKRKIHAIIVLTRFMKSKLLAGGFSEDRLHVRSNFVSDASVPPIPFDARTRQITFVGRFDAGKGVALCAKAWDLAQLKAWRLEMIGDGDLRESLIAEWKSEPTMGWPGRVPREQALEAMATSRFLVLPSIYYEGFPMVLLEAMSYGTPLIAPDHGPFPEIVEDGVNGIVFKAGDVNSLRDAMRRAASLPREDWTRLAQGSRARYVERYTTSVAYQRLLTIYARATAVAASERDAGVDRLPL